MAAKHENTYIINASMEQLRAAILDSAFSTKLNVSMKSENPSPTGIWYRFHHGVTIASWGEKITITLTPMGNMATQVHIHSECGMPTQIIDWGKNKQIVCNVYEYLEANVRRYPAGAPQIPGAQPPQFQNPVQRQFAAPQVTYCRNCGVAVNGQAAFCMSCGAKLR